MNKKFKKISLYGNIVIVLILFFAFILNFYPKINDVIRLNKDIV